MITLEKILLKKKSVPGFSLLLHIALWIAYFGIGYYFNTISVNLFAGTSFSWMEPLMSTINIILFYYPFMYFTWPLLVKRKKYIAVLLIIIQLLLFTVLFEIQERLLMAYCDECRQLLSQLPQYIMIGKPQQLSAGIISSFFSLGTLYILIVRLCPVIAIKIALDYTKERTTSLELEKENLQLEFDFLKSQVNPHFLFNTLNNIHSLIVQGKNPQASATLGRLSGFLRHSLYESVQASILLSQEIKLLQDYIELEKIRLNKTRIISDFSVDKNDFELPPLLFIPLLENAFKYTADNLTGDSYIEISLQQNNNILNFCCRNNYDPSRRNTSGGIGLRNLQKRLNYYYPGKHKLKVQDADSQYEIKIQIIHE